MNLQSQSMMLPNDIYFQRMQGWDYSSYIKNFLKIGKRNEQYTKEIALNTGIYMGYTQWA
jgi:hypothetical protein